MDIKKIQDMQISFSELKDIVFDSIQKSKDIAFYFKDLDSRFLMLSDSFAETFNIEDVNEAIGKTDFDYFSKPHAQQAYLDEQEIIRSRKPIIGKIEQETFKDDYISYVVTSKFPLFDIEGHLIGTWGHSVNLATVNSDVNKEPKKQKVIRSIMETSEASDETIDPLTQAKNVRAFYECMNIFYQGTMNSMHESAIEHFLIFLDLNHFSEISERNGHVYGDKILSYVATLLKDFENQDIKFFRYGGDEFALLIEHHSQEEVISLCQSILKRMKDFPYQEESFLIELSAAFGITRFKESLPYGSIHDIINLAERRLSEAKKNSSLQQIVYQSTSSMK
ncbi:MAG: diguanylate cyclase [Vallitaleaceae bacterium]|nr:diguanylate cyclase [Vallitaleaceae bacterium]